MAKRIEVLKTYKTYIGGKYPRTESGRFYKINDKKGALIANACRCSRKDVREAVVAARNAQATWQNRSAYNRGQILYRIAEVLEGRKTQFRDELRRWGCSKAEAETEVQVAVDRMIYYAGWSDKYQQVFSTVNPVASSHFNFSIPEPVGVVGVIAPDSSPLAGLVSMVAPVVAGGNSSVVLASETFPLSSINFAEVLQASDVPAGVINILTGYKNELTPPLSKHMGVNALFLCSETEKFLKKIEEDAALNVKRIQYAEVENWRGVEEQNPYFIVNFQEIKTIWHPVGN